MPFQTKSTRRVAILGGLRTPFARSAGVYKNLSNLDLLTLNLQALTRQFGLHGKRLGDVALGAVINHPRDWNLAREAVLHSGLSPETPAVGLQRACGTSLEAAILIGSKIALGQIDSGIAGGCDSMSDVPVFYQRRFAQRLLDLSRARTWQDKLKLLKGFSVDELKPAYPAVTEATTNLSMGESCELMAKHWKIPRDDQDQLALESHQKGVAAYKRGFYNDLICEVNGLSRDNNLREDTSLEKLAKLKPSFDKSPSGTLTAGNSSPLTDGSSAVLLGTEEWARANGQKPLAYLVDSEVAAINLHEEGLLMAPAYAVSRMLERNNLSLQDFDYYEIHEAFAAQVLCTLKAWESPEFCKKRLGRDKPLGSIDRSKMNVNGGSVALGHPFGATGGRILATLAKQLHEKGSGRGLISICTGGGMGVTAIIEA
ncbi:MAG TPA: acetyl-CoA C-acetyltransferase [Bdellovibrionales bacterium]|nr:acetyl-CoA C-acetyltransferase [Bdellovibrionales bacterium]